MNDATAPRLIRGRPAGMWRNGLKFGAEQEKSAELGPIQRLDAESIAHQRQRAFAAIPHADSEHADEPLHCRVDAVSGKGLQHHLGIGMAAKPNATRL